MIENPTHFKIKPLDSRQLLSFVTVAKTRSFTEAGKELCLSQSAVSHAVKALEDEIGHRLLDRDGKKMQITPAGEHLLHYASKILGEMSSARVSLDKRMRWGAERLRVGVNANFCQCLLPEILHLFYKEYPEWLVSVKTGDTRECVAWVDENVADMAVVVAPARAEAVELTPLFTDEVLWMVPPDHRWAQSGRAAVEEVESQNFICNNTASYTSRLLEKHFERDNIRLKFGLELGCLETVKSMVKAGAGITALAPWAARKELEEKSLVAVPLGKRKLRRNWCLVRSLNRAPSLMEAQFSKFSFAVTKSLAQYGSLAAMILNVVVPDGTWVDALLTDVSVDV